MNGLLHNRGIVIGIIIWGLLSGCGMYGAGTDGTTIGTSLNELLKNPGGTITVNLGNKVIVDFGNNSSESYTIKAGKVSDINYSTICDTEAEAREEMQKFLEDYQVQQEESPSTIIVMNSSPAPMIIDKTEQRQFSINVSEARGNSGSSKWVFSILESPAPPALLSKIFENR